jgi:hypothetical protein
MLLLTAYSILALYGDGYSWVSSIFMGVGITAVVSAIGGYLFLVAFFASGRNLPQSGRAPQTLSARPERASTSAMRR